MSSKMISFAKDNNNVVYLSLAEEATAAHLTCTGANIVSTRNEKKKNEVPIFKERGEPWHSHRIEPFSFDNL